MCFFDWLYLPIFNVYHTENELVFTAVHQNPRRQPSFSQFFIVCLIVFVFFYSNQLPKNDNVDYVK